MAGIELVTGKEIPELIPGISVGFRVYGDTTLAYVRNLNALRIGVAIQSIRDQYNQVQGEKIALRRAFDQYNMTYSLRKVLWQQYLYSRGIIPYPTVMQIFVTQAVEDMKHDKPHN